MPVENDQPEKTEVNDAEAVEAAAPEPAATATVQPYLVIGLLVAAVLIVVLAINLRPAAPQTADDRAALELQADLEAQRLELNRQRTQLGLSPLPGAGESESIDEIGARLSKDASTLVALSASFQKLIAGKDQDLAEKNSRLLEAGNTRTKLEAENAHLREQLRQAGSASANNELLVREIAGLKEQRDILAAELKLAKEKLGSLSDRASEDDVEDLERRLEEAVRARNFFESKMKELESGLKR